MRPCFKKRMKVGRFGVWGKNGEKEEKEPGKYYENPSEYRVLNQEWAIGIT